MYGAVDEKFKNEEEPVARTGAERAAMPADVNHMVPLEADRKCESRCKDDENAA